MTPPRPGCCSPRRHGSTDLTLPVLVPSVDAARQAAAFDERAERLAAACWPGAGHARPASRPRAPDAGTWAATRRPSGLRVPAHPLALAVLARTGPLAVTSANRSGDPPCRTCDELVAAFGDLVAVYLCEDEPLEAAASAVVDLAHGDPSVLREGASAPTDLDRLLAGGGPALDSRPPRAGSPGRPGSRTW